MRVPKEEYACMQSKMCFRRFEDLVQLVARTRHQRAVESPLLLIAYND